MPSAAALVLLVLLLYFDRVHQVWEELSDKDRSTRSFAFFMLYGTVLFPLGVLILLRAGRNWWLAVQSRSWPTVEGRVLESEVETVEAKGTFYFPRVRYEYEIEGRRYESRRLLFSHGPYSRADAEVAAERFPVGARPAVHYDPDDPGIAVLDTVVEANWSAVGAAIFFLLAPLIAFAS